MKLCLLISSTVSCINPHLLLFSDHLMIKAPQNPVMPGSNVSFSCNVSSELVLTGPNTSTCMPNGEWEPDLRKVACVGNTLHSILCDVCMYTHTHAYTIVSLARGHFWVSAHHVPKLISRGKK